MNIQEINQELQSKSPKEVIKWALSIAESPVVTTNFGPYSASILHAVSRIKNDVKVLWIDTGYNTPNTYRYASTLVDKLALNVITYIPCQTVAFRDVALGIPDVDDPKHVLFTKQVKLEPFARAMKEINPDLWFTNLRRGQTAFRDSIDIVSKNSDGLIKVSPFYNWSDQQLDEYLAEHSLPNELKYYDPTKQIANRECGLHS